MADHSKDPPGEDGKIAALKEGMKLQAEKSSEGEQRHHQPKGDDSALPTNSLEGKEQQVEGDAPAQPDIFVVQDGLNINITPSDPIIDSADFEELVRELCHKISPDIRIESTALAALHDFSEALLDGHFEGVCLRITPHEDLSFLSDAQFDFVKRIMNVLVLASAAG